MACVETTRKPTYAVKRENQRFKISVKIYETSQSAVLRNNIGQIKCCIGLDILTIGFYFSNDNNIIIIIIFYDSILHHPPLGGSR